MPMFKSQVLVHKNIFVVLRFKNHLDMVLENSLQNVCEPEPVRRGVNIQKPYIVRLMVGPVGRV